MNSSSTSLGDNISDESGVTAIEYGLLAALIAVTCIVAIRATGTSVSAMFNFWSRAVSTALAGAL